MLAFGAAAGALAAEGAGAAAGLLAVAGAGDLLAAGAASGLLAGAALASGAAAGVAGAAAVDVSAVAAFLDLLFFAGVAASPLAAGLAEASALAVLLLAVLSFASALLLFFVELFLLDVAASLEAAASVLPAALAVDLLLDLVDFEASAVVSVLLCVAPVLAAFFLVFFLAEAVASLWSFEVVDPACCAVRAEMLPPISSSAANSGSKTRLLHLMVFPSLRYRMPRCRTHSLWDVGVDSGRSRLAVRAFVARMGASSRRTQGKSRRNGA